MIDELRAESRHRLALRPRREFAVIEVPSALGLHPSGVQDAPDALREAGLHRLLKPTQVIRVDVPPYSPPRDTKAHMLNPEGISRLAMRVADRVQATIGDGRFPLVLGGDCSVVLGPLLALRRRGRYGLAFIVDLPQLRELGIGRALKRVAQLRKPELEGFWVHLDVDVLDDTLMPAVDHHNGALAARFAALLAVGVASIPPAFSNDVPYRASDTPYR